MTWNTVLRNMRENKQRKISFKPALSVSWLVSVMLISVLLLSGCSGQNGTAADKSAQGTAEEAGKNYREYEITAYPVLQKAVEAYEKFLQNGNRVLSAMVR